MKISEAQLAGLRIIETDMFGDPRGYFLETWSAMRYRESGLDAAFVQDNLSFSRCGTLRGLHFQSPNPQGKLAMVLQGEVYDVAVDLRRGSPTFGRWEAVVLSGKTHQQFYLPPGFAHGFQVTSDTALFHYKCTAPYSPSDERTIRWDDPGLGIPWPMPDPIVSAKDMAALPLAEFPRDLLFD